MQLIVPKIKIETKDQKIIFLAGPIGGVETWQDKAISIISDLGFQGILASPNYCHIDENSKRFLVSSGQEIEEILDWETFYLNLASKTGAAMFWLPGQTKPLPVSDYTGFQRPYARDTRRELSEYITRKEYNPNRRIVIGGTQDFDGFRIFRKRIIDQISSSFPVYSTLEKTCEEAVKIANKKL